MPALVAAHLSTNWHIHTLPYEDHQAKQCKGQNQIPTRSSLRKEGDGTTNSLDHAIDERRRYKSCTPQVIKVPLYILTPRQNVSAFML